MSDPTKQHFVFYDRMIFTFTSYYHAKAEVLQREYRDYVISDNYHYATPVETVIDGQIVICVYSHLWNKRRNYKKGRELMQHSLSYFSAEPQTINQALDTPCEQFDNYFACKVAALSLDERLGYKIHAFMEEMILFVESRDPRPLTFIEKVKSFFS